MIMIQYVCAGELAAYRTYVAKRAYSSRSREKHAKNGQAVHDVGQDSMGRCQNTVTGELSKNDLGWKPGVAPTLGHFFDRPVWVAIT